MKSGKSTENPLKKKSMIEDFEAALSEHARALKREGTDVHASDRNMWNWRDTALCKTV